MRVLFASTQGAGHFGPLIPFIDACERHGHETLVVGPPTLKARGYPFKAGATPPDDVLGPIWGGMSFQPPGQADIVVVGTIFGRLNVDAMLPTLQETIEEWQPDLVLREGAEFASAVAADRLGVPHVRIAVGVAMFEEAMLAVAGPALEERSTGLTSRIAESPYLTCFPASVDPPPFGVVRFRAPATETAPQPLPEHWPDDDRPLVYVSFGSVAATIPPAAQVYPRSLEAVAGLPVRVVLTRGGNEIDLGDVPDNVHVENWVDEPAVLAHAAASVGHGGSGTTLSALAAACPTVIVPLFGDQPGNAVRVAVAGSGVVSSLDRIGPSIELVLRDERYRAAARRIADEMRTLPPVDEFLTLFD